MWNYWADTWKSCSAVLGGSKHLKTLTTLVIVLLLYWHKYLYKIKPHPSWNCRKSSADVSVLSDSGPRETSFSWSNPDVSSYRFWLMHQRFQRFCLCGQHCVIVTFLHPLMFTSMSLQDMCWLCGSCLETRPQGRNILTFCHGWTMTELFQLWSFAFDLAQIIWSISILTEKTQVGSESRSQTDTVT